MSANVDLKVSKAMPPKSAGLELVKFVQRPVFLSPPLMFCFKGCSVGITCGRCKQLVRPSKQSIKNSVNNGTQTQEDLLTQLSNHYLINFWISETLHLSFFQEKPELNREACCIVCQKTFSSISRVIRHVREIVLDLSLRSRTYHWLILENVTNLFVNRDIGFVSNEELIELLGKLFPRYPDISLYGRPSFTQIFQSLRSVIEASSGLSFNPEVVSTETSRNEQPNAGNDNEDSDATATDTSGTESELSNAESEFVVLDITEDPGELSTVTSNVVAPSDDDDEMSSFSHILNSDRGISGVSENGCSEFIDSDCNLTSDAESDSPADVEITWVTHRERVTRWVSMRPVGGCPNADLQLNETSEKDGSDLESLDERSGDDVADVRDLEIHQVHHSNIVHGSSSTAIARSFIANTSQGLRRVGVHYSRVLTVENDDTVEEVSDCAEGSEVSTFFEELNVSSPDSEVSGTEHFSETETVRSPEVISPDVPGIHEPGIGTSRTYKVHHDQIDELDVNGDTKKIQAAEGQSKPKKEVKKVPSKTPAKKMLGTKKSERRQSCFNVTGSSVRSVRQ